MRIRQARKLGFLSPLPPKAVTNGEPPARAEHRLFFYLRRAVRPPTACKAAATLVKWHKQQTQSIYRPVWKELMGLAKALGQQPPKPTTYCDEVIIVYPPRR